MILEQLQEPSTWVALLSLTALELVLGIDNVVFIAILTDRLPEDQRKPAYRLGLGGAMVTRIGLLFAITWVMKLTAPLFTVLSHEISGRDLILLVGGLFLIGKSAHEIYNKVELSHDEDAAGGGGASFASVIVQIMILDIVFSLDSVITAVGMVDADKVWVMVTAVVASVLMMLLFAQPVGNFVNKNPSMKILALSFLLLIGVLLTAESLDQHMNKGYVYFAMAFALIIELLNLRFRRKRAADPSP